MVQTCCVLNCIHQKTAGDGVSFFFFPNNAKRLKMWVNAIGRPDYEPTRFSRICSKHFAPECFNTSAWSKVRKSLRKDAVPSIFERYDEAEVANENIRQEVLDPHRAERILVGQPISPDPECTDTKQGQRGLEMQNNVETANTSTGDNNHDSPSPTTSTANVKIKAEIAVEEFSESDSLEVPLTTSTQLVPKQILPRWVQPKKIIRRQIQLHPTQPRQIQPQPIEPKPVQPQPTLAACIAEGDIKEEMDIEEFSVPDNIEFPQPQPIQQQTIQLQPIQLQAIQQQLLQQQRVQQQSIQQQPFQPQLIQPQFFQLLQIEPQLIKSQPPIQPHPPIQPQPIQQQVFQLLPIQPQPIQQKPIQLQQIQRGPIQPQQIQRDPIQPQLIDPQPIQTTCIAEEGIKEEIDIEEFSVPDNEDDDLTISDELIPKPIQSQPIELEIETELPDLVFTFKNRHHQPTQEELISWLTNTMFYNKPDILQNIQMLKVMNGCFIIRVRKSQKIQLQQGIFIQIGRGFNDARKFQTEKWRIERFDIVPGPVWICVYNLPPWVTDKEIVKELAQFGRIIKKVIIQKVIPQWKNCVVVDGDTYVQMEVSKHVPTDLTICGCIAWIKYCDSPVTP